MKHHTLIPVLLMALLGALPCAYAKQKICIFDPVGAGGEGAQAAKDYNIAMGKFGVDLEAKIYMDERVAVEDFRTGQCDGVTATALRTRQFNALSASLDSVGASSIVRNGKVDMAASFDVVRRFIQTLSAPKAASLMVVGEYEVAGILPLGAAYAFVNDRTINTLEKAAGKRVGAFDYDPAQAQLIQRIGARPVAVNVANFASMFNNGNVDVIAAPALVYKPFELYKGLGKKGGVGRFPLTILTYQLIIRADKFPKGFGQHSREYVAARFEQVLPIIQRVEKDIPESMWIDPPASDVDRYMVMMRQGRVVMADKGFYDKTGLKIIKKIRCSIQAEAPECTEPTETWK
jgi:hypothetical protein